MFEVQQFEEQHRVNQLYINEKERKLLHHCILFFFKCDIHNCIHIVSFCSGKRKLKGCYKNCSVAVEILQKPVLYLKWPKLVNILKQCDGTGLKLEFTCEMYHFHFTGSFLSGHDWHCPSGWVGPDKTIQIYQLQNRVSQATVVVWLMFLMVLHYKDTLE